MSWLLRVRFLKADFLTSVSWKDVGGARSKPSPHPVPASLLRQAKLAFQKDMMKPLAPAFLSSPLAAAAAVSSALSLPPRPSASLFQAPAIPPALLRPGHGPIRATPASILFAPYWRPAPRPPPAPTPKTRKSLGSRVLLGTAPPLGIWAAQALAPCSLPLASPTRFVHLRSLVSCKCMGQKTKQTKCIYIPFSDSFSMGVIWLRHDKEYFPDRLEN